MINDGLPSRGQCGVEAGVRPIHVQTLGLEAEATARSQPGRDSRNRPAVELS